MPWWVTTILIFLFFIAILLYFQILKPYLLMKFYRNQGIPMTFIPLTGYYTRDNENVQQHDDFFHDWINYARMEPRTKAFGGNYGSRAHLVLLDPQLIKEFLTKHELYIKDPSLLLLLREICGDGLVVSHGESWKRKRRLTSSVFHFDFLREIIPEIVSTANELLDEWDIKQNISIIQSFQEVTGNIVGRVLLGSDFSKYKIKGQKIIPYFADLIATSGELILDPLFQYFGKKLAKWGLDKRHAEILNMISNFRECCHDIVQERLKESKNKFDNGKIFRKSLIDLLYEQNKNSDDGLNDWEITDEFITFFFGGMDTTGHLLGMASYFLLKNPQYKEKLMNEIKTNFQAISKIDYDVLNNMEFLGAFLKECLRMATPSAINFERMAIQDHQLGDINIKKGTIMLVGTQANNMDDHFHEEPNKFWVERWLDPNSKTMKSISKEPFIWTTFLGGPRNCLGQHLAMIEAKIVFGFFLLKYEYILNNPNYQLKMTERFLYEPEENLIYKLRKRNKINGQILSSKQVHRSFGCILVVILLINKRNFNPKESKDMIYNLFEKIRYGQHPQSHCKFYQFIQKIKVEDLHKMQYCNLWCLPENYTSKYYFYHFLNWNQLLYVAEDTNQKIVGYVLAKIDEESDETVGHITSLSVLRTHRKLGLAYKLMSHAHKDMVEVFDAVCCTLHVRVTNRAALGLYEGKLKYDRVGVEEKYYADEEDAYIMKKTFKKSADTKEKPSEKEIKMTQEEKQGSGSTAEADKTEGEQHEDSSATAAKKKKKKK